jgi:hypothetical protein
MAAALTVTVAKSHNGATASLTGGPATAAVTFIIAQPQGGNQTMIATTDGTGAASVTFVPCSPGTVSVSVISPQPATAVVGPITAKVT